MNIWFCKGTVFGPVSGPDEAILNYADALIPLGHSVAVLVMYAPRRDDPYLPRFAQKGIEIHCLSSGLRYQALRLIRRLMTVAQRVGPGGSPNPWRSPSILLDRRARAVLRHHKPNVIHILEPNGGTSIVVTVARAMGIPTIYQESLTPFTLTENQQWYAELFDVIGLYSGVTALSPTVSRMWRDRLGQVEVGVLPLIVRDPGFPRPPKPSDRALTFGFASRLDYWKGPVTLVDAFAKARGEMNGALLKLAGSGSQESAVRERIAFHGLEKECELVGAYNGDAAKTRFMDSVDVFVQPSTADGTPNSVIEAMAHGLPIIASAVGGISDFVSQENGILTPSANVDALSSALVLMSASPQRRQVMGQGSRAIYETLFSEKAVLPLLFATYDRAIHGDRSALVQVTHPWAGRR